MAWSTSGSRKDSSKKENQSKPSSTAAATRSQPSANSYAGANTIDLTMLGARNPYTSRTGSLYAGASQQRMNGINDMLGSIQSDYDARMRAMSGMFNFGEDPNAIAQRDWALRELANQRDSANSAIGTAYGRGIDSTRQAAQQALDLARNQGSQQAAIFNSAVSAINAGNAQLASEAADGAGALGISGPVGGESVNIQAALAASAPREQALAASIGQIANAAQNSFASSMEGQRAAEQGAMQRQAAAMSASIASEYAKREASRQQAERQAYMQAQMDLANQMDQRRFALQQLGLDTQSDQARQAAEWALQRDLFNTEEDQNLRKFQQELAISGMSSNALIQMMMENPEAAKAILANAGG